MECVGQWSCELSQPREEFRVPNRTTACPLEPAQNEPHVSRLRVFRFGIFLLPASSQKTPRTRAAADSVCKFVPLAMRPPRSSCRASAACHDSPSLSVASRRCRGGYHNVQYLGTSPPVPGYRGKWAKSHRRLDKRASSLTAAGKRAAGGSQPGPWNGSGKQNPCRSLIALGELNRAGNKSRSMIFKNGSSLVPTTSLVAQTIGPSSHPFPCAPQPPNNTVGRFFSGGGRLPSSPPTLIVKRDMRPVLRRWDRLSAPVRSLILVESRCR